MSAHEASGKSDEWYTPAYIFEALGCRFDLDVAAPVDGPLHVPALRWFSSAGLVMPWSGFVWMNPPFGGRNGYRPWAAKFVEHADGIALAPNRTGAPWLSWFMARCDRALFVSPKIKFIRPDGSLGKSPGYGSVLLSIGERGNAALERARSLGTLMNVANPNRFPAPAISLPQLIELELRQLPKLEVRGDAA